MDAPVVSDLEFRAVSDTGPEERYAYFVRRVVEWETVYVLHHDGIATVRTEAGDAVPIWPHRRFADDAAGGFPGYAPVEQGGGWLVGSLLPDLREQEMELIVMYLPERLARRVPADELLRDVEEERTAGRPAGTAPPMTDDLEARYERWFDAVRQAGSAWMLADDEHNAVMEDPDEPRDLHMLFVSETDAAGHADGETRPAALELGELVPILESADERGDGLTLWDGERWVIADPGPLADALR